MHYCCNNLLTRDGETWRSFVTYKHVCVWCVLMNRWIHTHSFSSCKISMFILYRSYKERICYVNNRQLTFSEPKDSNHRQLACTIPWKGYKESFLQLQSPLGRTSWRLAKMVVSGIQDSGNNILNVDYKHSIINL